VLDGDDKDAVGLPQVVGQLRGVDTIDLYGGDTVGKARLETGVESDPFGFDQPLGPAVPQVDQTGGLAPDSDSLVEGQRLGDGQIVGGRVGADLLELADVVVHLVGGGHQRPQIPDLVPSDIEQAGAMGSKEPLVEAGGEVVAVEVLLRKVVVGKGVGAVDDHRDPLLSGHLHDLAHRQDLTGDVDHVAHEDHPGAGGDVLLEEGDDLIRVLGRDGNLELAQDDPVATLALLEGGDHPPVVLGGGQHLVTWCQIETELTDLQSLRGVTSERDLLRVAVEEAGQTLPHRLTLGLQDPPHGVGRHGVRVVEMPLHGALHHGGGGADPPVVEIDEAPVGGKGLLDTEPEGFVGGDLPRAAGVGGQVLYDGGNPFRPECGDGHQGTGGQRNRAEKLAATMHGDSLLGTRLTTRNRY
jgi:hypothetical protein